MTVETFFSPSWYRVAELKPRLRKHTKIHHHTYRGEDWFVLQDYASGRMHRFSPAANQLIGLMDGSLSLKDIWKTACARLGDDMPSQDEVIGLLAQLHQADALQTDIPPDIADLHLRRTKGKSSRLLGYLQSPLSLRIPLLDPDRFLEKTLSYVRPFLGWPGLFLWCYVIISAAIVAGMQWRDLTDNLSDRVLSLENILLLGMIYPVVKCFHEFGHAYTVKRWGGEVHEMGIMFLVFMPIPYVDATAASAFVERKQRMAVGGAGIVVDLFLAAVALHVWNTVEPGAVRSLAFNVVMIAGVSTVLFNGNPLLRYDAYYILADYLEIPNLGMRSSRYIGYLLQKYLLGIREVVSPVTAAGEPFWFMGYGIVSFIYRMVIMAYIILFVAGKFFFAGVIIAIWSGISLLAMPLIKVGKFIIEDAKMRRKRLRTFMVIGMTACALLLAVAIVPCPYFMMSEGVVWVPEESRVRAGTDGFIQEVLIKPGQDAALGTPLIRCENIDLEARVKVLSATLEEFEARHRALLVKDQTESEIVRDEIKRLREELTLSHERLDELVIRSPASGVFVASQIEDLPGTFVRRGTPLGYVVDFSSVLARSLVDRDDIAMVRSRTRKVEIRLAENVMQSNTTRLLREVPAATKEMPSMALSLEGGGKRALDPKMPEKATAFESFFQFEVSLANIPVNRIDERVYLRFSLEPEPLIFRWYRNLRRVFLRRFEV